MDKQSAIKLVRETFDKPFDKEQFVRFVKELFNRISVDAFEYYGQYIPDSFKPYISKYERIGKYQGSDDNRIDVLVVYLEKEKLIERARTMQRNFIAGYLAGKYGSTTEKNAALVAFISLNEEDWRFSLVKMEYKLTQTKTGRPKGEEEFTPAKRFSFLVGKNEPNHTAQSRLYPILKDVVNNPTLTQLEDAFDIETVTKEFFLKYRELFLRTKEELDRVVKNDPKVEADFEAKSVDTVNFAKKLLGQIIFLYFLQKKGWFGVGRDDDWGTGSKHFLRELFDKKHGDYKNFFNDILEPLFYEALRTGQERKHEDYYYSRFNCKIPFLNGGLFDPIGNYDWVHTDIIIPDKLFSNSKKTKEGDTGDGILDIFDRYNFTVKEDEPLEKEVAIDPELLGKAYEKFNAIRPDNYDEFRKALKSGKKGEENKFNKKFGVYYTPREIVHYMCQQSLINYLATELESKVKKEAIEFLILEGEKYIEHLKTAKDKKEANKNYRGDYKEKKHFIVLKKHASEIDNSLSKIKVCDPAVGSGAFPVGMMIEIIKPRMFFVETGCLENIYINSHQEEVKRTTYNYKRDCIEHSLYGVDIDPGAVEIAKLRLWLSLVVDEDDIKNIKPLPNLDYRIMQGNSLISEFMGINFDFDEEKGGEDLVFKDETHELIEQFQQKKDEFLNESNVTRKSKLKEEVEALLIEIFETKLKTQKADYFSRLKDIENRYSILTNEKQRDELVKQDKEKLYKESGFDIESAEKQLKEFTSGRQIKPFFLWNLYFSEVFHEKDGFDVVIANPPYVGERGNKEIFRETKAKDFGKKFYKRKMDYFYFFFHKAISVVKKGGIVSFITTNYYITADGAINLRRDFHTRTIIHNLINFNELKIFDSAKGQHNMITILQKDVNREFLSKNCIIKRTGNSSDEILKNILSWRDEKTGYFSVKQKNLYDGENKYIRLSNNSSSEKENKFNSIFNKIKNDSVLLGNLKNINQGVLSGVDKVTNKHCKMFNISEDQKGKGVFVLSEKELTELDLNDKERTIIKPYYKNSDIFRYFTNPKGNKKNLIYATRELSLNDYPNIKKHFLRYEKIIKYRSKNRGEMQAALKLGKWWVIFAARKGVDFEGPKIVCPQRSPKNTFGYNNEVWYGGTDIYIITNNGDKNISLKYVLSLLNSKLFFLWLCFKGKRKGELLELLYKPLAEIPIKIISETEQTPFVEVVDRILVITKDDDYLQNPQKQSKVKALEAEIDQLIYKLYDLNPDEIKIVENVKKQQNVEK